jgi:signal transduction histidine kinase
MLRLEMALAQTPASSQNGVIVSSSAPVVSILDDSDLPIRRKAEYLRDISGVLTIDSVVAPQYSKQFQLVESDYPNFGYTSDKIWIRLTVRNTLAVPTTRILDAATAIVDSTAFYTPLSSGEYRREISGNAIFIDLRALKNRRNAFRMTLQPFEQKTYYIQANGANPIIFNLTLYTQDKFNVLEHNDYSFYGIMWGITLCMIAFNAALFLVTVNRLYLIASAHLVASLLTLTAVIGIVGEYIWFDVAGYNQRILSSAVFISNACSLIFCQYFCLTRRFAPRLYRVINVSIILCIFAAILGAFGYVTLIMGGLATVVNITMLVSAGFIAAKHSPSVLKVSYWIYSCSWIVSNVGTILASLAGTTVFPEYGDFFATKFGVFFGAVQIVMESFSLSMNTVQAQRQLADEQEQRGIAERERELEHERNLELTNINTSMHKQQEELRMQKVQTEQANLMLKDVNSKLLRQQEMLEHQKEVTERINAELQERYAELKIADKEKNEFLGIAAHDLKNPLTGLKGMIEILRSGDDIKPTYLNRMALTMQQSVDRMFDIVRNLLDVNAIEQGAMQPALRVDDLLMLTKNVCDGYRLASANKRITIEFKANAPEILCTVDSGFLTQIADNLVSNAVKYSPSHTTVFVRTFKIIPSETNTTLRPEIVEHFGIHELHRLQTPMGVLLVQDQGPGLNDDDKLKLFQKFARLSAQPTGGEHSTGLGLSIAKRLVASMNGQIWCESTHGNGATFVVAFPLAET